MNVLSYANKYKTRMICLSLFLLFSFGSTSYAEGSTLPEGSIYIDNKPVKTKYVLREGHLHVPAIFMKNTGAYVDWNSEYKSVVFRLKNTMFALPIGEKYFDDYDKATNTWKRHPLLSETTEINGVPFVPLANVTKQLGMGVTYNASSKSTFITTNNSVEPNGTHHVKSQNKLVALTFDDGPDTHYTPMILDILKEKGVHATFFVMGKNVGKYPSMMKRIVKEGHGLGNHSYDHGDMSRQWTSDVVDEIQSTQQELLKVVGRKPDIIRPPYGATTKADIAKMNELGLRNVLWSVDTLDWERTPGDEILETVKRQIFPGGIILQHNFVSTTGELDGTIDALPKIIDELRAQGYKFVTVQTLLANQTK